MIFKKLIIKSLALFLVFNFTFVSSLKAEAVFVDNFSVATQETGPIAIAFNNDGTKMFVAGTVGRDVNEYSLSTGFDLSSTVSFVRNLDVSSKETYIAGIAFNTTGTKMFISGVANKAHEYSLSTGFDLSTASFVTSLDLVAQESGVTAIAFNNDGTKLFVLGYNGRDVDEYTLSTGFDLSSTLTYVDSFDISSQETDPMGIAFNSDGTKMFISGPVGDDVNEYTLSTGFDLTSTVTFIDNFDASSQDSDVRGLTFNNDGTKMFIVGRTGDDINEYSISCSFQVTASSTCDSTSSASDPTTDKDVIALIDAQVQGSKRLAEQTTNSILDRIKHVRSQDTIDQASQDVNISFNNPDLILATSLITMSKIPNLNPFQGLQTDEWSSWIKADVTIGRIGDTSLSSVQDISIQGVSLGADRKIDDDKMYGVSLRFANDDTDIGNAGTKISTQSVNLSVYGSRYLDNDTFMDGVVGAGYKQSDLVRKSGSNTLNGDRKGNQIFGSLKFGKQIKQSQFNIAPYGKIHSSYTQLEGYSETGTDALKFDALEIGATSGSVGLEIDQLIKYQESSVKPRFILEYGKEIGSDSTQDMYYVSDTSTKYSHTSDQKDRDVMTAGIGFDFVHDNGLTLSTDYERKQNDDNDYFDSVFITANFLSRKESQYSLSFQGSDGDLVSQLEASKRLGLFDINAQLENNFNTSANNQLSLSASYNF